MNEITKKNIHLTNYSINKENLKYKENNLSKTEMLEKENLNPEKVSKWDFEMLKKKYTELKIDFDDIFDNIKKIAIKSLITIEPHLFNKIKK